MQPPPLYTIESCRAAYQLNWSLTLFWKQAPPSAETWLEQLRAATETDHVRILEHRFTDARNSQFLLSTRPTVSPSATIRSVKGRLQHEVKRTVPKAFQRNYSIQSVGSANSDTTEQYVMTQTEHHTMADPAVQQRMERYQFADTSVDLRKMRRSAHGLFSYSLHLVLVHRDRDFMVDEEALQRTFDTVRKISARKGHLLSRAGLLADHLHLTLGCDVKESPGDIALSYMNNLALAHGRTALFEESYYAGTFGPYDLNAVRQNLAVRRGAL